MLSSILRPNNMVEHITHSGVFATDLQEKRLANPYRMAPILRVGNSELSQFGPAQLMQHHQQQDAAEAL